MEKMGVFGENCRLFLKIIHESCFYSPRKFWKTKKNDIYVTIYAQMLHLNPKYSVVPHTINCTYHVIRTQHYFYWNFLVKFVSVFEACYVQAITLRKSLRNLRLLCTKILFIIGTVRFEQCMWRLVSAGCWVEGRWKKLPPCVLDGKLSCQSIHYLLKYLLNPVIGTVRI